MTEFQSFLKYKSCLRHRAFGCINKENYTIHHFKHTFNFSAEIRMAGSINYIYFNIFVMNGCIFSKNSYSSFSFNVVAIHNSFINSLVITKCSALFQHFVNESSFSMVNVSNNRYVSQIFSYHLNSSSLLTYSLSFSNNIIPCLSLIANIKSI